MHDGHGHGALKAGSAAGRHKARLAWAFALTATLIGIAVNLVSMRLLAGGAGESLNIRGSYFEALSDFLGSIAVIIAALTVMTTGWTLADHIVGAAIGLFILPRTWRLLKEAVHILLEGVPAAIDLTLLERALMEIPGVTAVHDLHVWTLTSGLDSMSGHVVVDDARDARRVLAAARTLMKERFGLDHVTIQIEDAALAAEEAKLRL